MSKRKKVMIIVVVILIYIIGAAVIVIGITSSKADISKEDAQELIVSEMDSLKTAFEEDGDEIIPVITKDSEIIVRSVKKKDGKTVAECEFLSPNVYSALESLMKKYGYEQVTYDFMMDEIVQAILNAPKEKQAAEVTLEKKDDQWQVIMDYNVLDAYLGGYISFGTTALKAVDETEQ